MIYQANAGRYRTMVYKKSGNSGLKLPVVSLGLWHNFGNISPYETMKALCFTAFDNGITHFDLANNYGPPPGAAETHFGRILREEMGAYRDEMLISTKAGYTHWEGPYGNGGGRKYLLASLDQSLKRLGLEYVDIFYHHRPDKETPLEESMMALDQAVKSGKALYAGLSNYDGARMREATAILKELKCPFVINQNRYSIFDRSMETSGLLSAAADENKGIIVYSPLAQGLLTTKYLNGIPSDSRVRTSGQFLKESQITLDKVEKARALDEIARERGQSLPQMALSWVLRHECVTSVLIGASKPEQIVENIGLVDSAPFSDEELARIDAIVLGD